MNSRTLLGSAVALALGACASTPVNNAALDTARTAVHAAEADPNVGKYAALDLSKAEGQLDVAEQANLKHNDPVVNQAAYLATQTARLAQVRGAQKADDALVAAGQVERDRIELAARTRQLANAQANAAQAQVATANAKMAAIDANIEAASAMQQRDDAAQQAASAMQQRDAATQQAASAMQQRDDAAEQATRLQAEIDALKATPTPRGLVLTLGGDVLFDTGKADLKSGASRKLDQLAQFLNEHKDRRVEIDGFTDSIGSNAYNDDLSKRRAEAVKSALEARNVDGSRIDAEGFGKEYPVAGNNDSAGRQLNRRVEVVIGQQGGTAIAPRG
jgi:outer membrane protein OmpA-like peptidoglycan-associated protein